MVLATCGMVATSLPPCTALLAPRTTSTDCCPRPSAPLHTKPQPDNGMCIITQAAGSDSNTNIPIILVLPCHTLRRHDPCSHIQVTKFTSSPPPCQQHGQLISNSRGHSFALQAEFATLLTPARESHSQTTGQLRPPQNNCKTTERLISPDGLISCLTMYMQERNCSRQSSH